MSRFELFDSMVDAASQRDRLRHPSSGGFCAFEGWVRNSNEGREVDGLSYEAYAELAIAEGERIVAEAIARYGVTDARCVHRTGDLKIGDMAVWVGASAPHRDEAFRACRYIIDEIKHRLPIWKKEHYVTGESNWVACTHVYREHEHEDHHGHHHHDHAHAKPFVPDYSRQVRLREVGEAGQAKLAASRVLVIGAGGLGCPVISYLAGAGVGMLGVVDGDRLDASNLHRQTMYDARDVGEYKADLAARRVAALNPTVRVQLWKEPLDARHVLDVFRQFDLVVECTDDMRSRYLSSDAAVLTGTPLILASIYQYEGQLQFISGKPGAPCLRCLWPQEPAPETIGSCTLAGVLGPVPGVLGAMQATEALKVLLGIPQPNAGSLSLVNLIDLSIQHLPIDAAQGCAEHGGCVDVARRSLARAVEDDDIDLVFDRLDDAVSAGFLLVDVRDAEERISDPMPVAAVHVPSAQVAERAGEFVDGRYLLVCASGRRSGHAARLLRDEGVRHAYSLAGGLNALRIVG
ncbi:MULTISPECIES: ThiF family adenylyltransferase [unclassified Dyella]|uniref:ThiF family adenylyltransferase n=1 Tax=unclassified Dyella TaxID=2634549 RepID=UPI000C830605|nr:MULTISPECIES: ThiF family adenylyltransferase [unclassified Dyella]MDR3446270.1 ThiF family adenylyltransferase [Dyella sp.]PMQ02725.1 putative adenylyltransferase/sulfurtransferase MoeZ [Dyella sp. AD56]